MSETDNGPQDDRDRYEQFAKMTLEEIKEHLEALGETFAEVKKHYEGRIGRLRREIKREDMDKIMEIFQDLLPMTMNPGVQEEVSTEDIPLEELTGYRISAMMQDTMQFAASFENTDITAIPVQKPRRNFFPGQPPV